MAQKINHQTTSKKKTQRGSDRRMKALARVASRGERQEKESNAGNGPRDPKIKNKVGINGDRFRRGKLMKRKTAR